MPRIEVMSPTKGDDLLAEWGEDTGVENLRGIKQKFEALQSKGYRAFTVRTGHRVDAFDPRIEEDIVFIAPLVGG